MINLKNRTKAKGFTIVELLIVIVIIGVLATITIISYNGIQRRARDTKRIADAQNIIKSLSAYYYINGRYPDVTIDGETFDDWEVSSGEPDGMFLEYLTDITGPAPLDPINSRDYVDPHHASAYGYYYHVYDPGEWGCDASKGNYFVVAISKMETSEGVHPSSPGWSCGPGNRDWEEDGEGFEWVYGSYADTSIVY